MEMLLIFCRVVIGVVFAISAYGKAHDLKSFADSIEKFQLLPANLVKMASWVFLVGEVLVGLAMIINALTLGFTLAALMLSLFSFALISALLRRLELNCNCFGTLNSQISGFDLIRNAVFILCALYGLANAGVPLLLRWDEIILVAAAALVFAVVFIHFSEMIRFMRIPEIG